MVWYAIKPNQPINYMMQKIMSMAKNFSLEYLQMC